MDNHHKPTGEAAGWHRLSTDYPFKHRILNVRRDHVDIAGQHTIDYAYLESDGAVWVVPVTPDGQIVLIKQYRYSVDEWVWEVPAGGMFDHDGDPESLAHRELMEEIGGQAERMQYVGWFYGGVAITNSKCHVFIAHNTRLTQEPEREVTEMLEAHLFPMEEVMRMARSGEMHDGRSALAVLRSEPFLRDTDKP